MKYKEDKTEKRRSKSNLTKGAFGRAMPKPSFDPDISNHARIKMLREKRTK